MKKKKYKSIYMIMILLLLMVGVGYAILQANLEINGTTKIANNTWDIHFDHIQVNQDSVSIGNGDSAATIDSNNNCKVDFSVTLNVPGDFYEFTVDVVNAGTIDGMIGTLTKTLKVNNVATETVPEYLIYSVTYDNGTEILENQLLAKNTSETLLVHLEFRNDIDSLPTGAPTIATSIEPIFIQADSGATPINHRVPVVLDDGMIPVTIANDGTVTTVSEGDSTWYDYDNKIWANAVLVKESGVKTREQNKVAGTIINQDDILAYYVWIPRYSYKIWTLDASQVHTGEEQTIDIKFVDTNTKENASAVGDWYTHPAFTFGTEELPGFWVGKFESSTDTSSTCYTSPSTDNCNNTNQSPRIVPNVHSLRYQHIGNQFATSLKFAGGTQSGSNVTFAGSSTYGLTSSADSHIMKNSEWGAVAYLSHSNYGINGEIRDNNDWDYRTGCGRITTDNNDSTTCDIAYGGASSYPQSTTGNISGIFDMSGGTHEIVMGNYDNFQSGIGFSTLPESKYYDVYLSNVFIGTDSTNITFCTLASCGGHALNETYNWYEDGYFFIDFECPWFVRGGNYFNDSHEVGIYNFGVHYGGPIDYITWRSVLVAR